MAGKNTTQKATPLTEEQLIAKEVELKSTEAKLESETKVLEGEKAEHQKNIEKLASDQSTFESAKLEHDKSVEEFNKKVEAFEASKNVEETTLEEEAPKGLDFTLDTEKHKFKDSAPETLLFNGKARTQKELVKDENALRQLVGTGIYTEKL